MLEALENRFHTPGYLLGMLTDRLQAHRIFGMVILRVSRWMTERTPSLALEKTKVVVLTNEEVPAIHFIQVGETMVLSRATVEDLGIMIDTKQSYFEQIRSTDAALEYLRFAG